MKDAIFKQAETLHGATLTPSEARARGETLGTLSRQLGETADETDKLLGAVPPEAKPALQKIADSARDGQKKLLVTRELSGKEKD